MGEHESGIPIGLEKTASDTGHIGLKVLIVGIAWPPETFIARLIKGLIESGVEVTVACDKMPEAEWLPHPGLKWLRAPAWQGSTAIRLFRTATLMLRAVFGGVRDVRVFNKHIRRLDDWSDRIQNWHRLLPFAGKRWDSIYFPWNSAAISYLPLFDLDMPVVISCRGTQVNVAPHNPKRSPIREGLQTTFERAAVVHCVSEAMMQEALRCGLNANKAHIIRPAVNPDFFRPTTPQRTDGDVFQIVMTGSLNWVKGYEYALQAVRHLLNEGVNARLAIIGKGFEKARLLYTIEDLGLENHVRLLGSLSPEEIRDQLQQANVFLLSSVSEGISNAVLEAMACALPIVTTNCGGMREAVRDGVDGFVIPVRNAEAMASALLRFANDPALRTRVGHSARQRIVNEFDLANQVHDYLSMFRSASEQYRFMRDLAPAPAH